MNGGAGVPVELRSSEHKIPLDTRRLKKEAQTLLEALGESKATLSILLTGDRQMAKLHEQWMGIRGPTDVLSFPMGELSGGPVLLGDVVISVETAARRRPKNVRAEVIRVLIHGILHLKGYDHRALQARHRMSREARRLSALLKKRTSSKDS